MGGEGKTGGEEKVKIFNKNKKNKSFKMVPWGGSSGCVYSTWSVSTACVLERNAHLGAPLESC